MSALDKASQSQCVLAGKNKVLPGNCQVKICDVKNTVGFISFKCNGFKKQQCLNFRGTYS